MTALIALLGGVAMTTGPLWRWAGDYLVTIAHEGGHAIAAVLCSGRVEGIRLHASRTARRTGVAGVTRTATYTYRRQVPILLAGYPAPAFIGLLALALLYNHHTRGALATMVASLCVMLALIRNIFGACLLVAVGAVLYLAIIGNSATIQAGVLGAIAWTLLLGATRDAINAFSAGSGDATGLASLAGAPPKFWSTLFVLATVAATGYAGWLTLTAWF